MLRVFDRGACISGVSEVEVRITGNGDRGCAWGGPPQTTFAIIKKKYSVVL